MAYQSSWWRVLLLPCIAGLVGASVAAVQPQSVSAAAVSTNVVISQVYGGGQSTSADTAYKSDYIELFNLTGSPVSLDGWSVQYAATTSSSFAVTTLSGSIPAYGYYLIQEGTGTVGADLPSPDLVPSSPISMAAANGKVALVQGTTAVNCSSCSGIANVVDFIGYGTANDSETSAAPAIDRTKAALRAGNGCTDTGVNSADFTAGAPSPRNSASPTNSCSVATSTPTTPTSTGTVTVTPVTPTATATPVTPTATPGAYTPIFTIQGTTDTSPLAGSTVTTQGIVTQINQGRSGMFIQDATGDGNAATSDGIYIYGTISAEIAAGNLVQVSGAVSEFQGLTEITLSSVTVLDSSTSVPTPIVLDLPDAPQASYQNLERYEGMLVSIPETLTVDQNYFQGRYGQVTLSSGGRAENPTNRYRPGTAAANELTAFNAARMIVLDDASSAQNPNPIPYIGADNTLRAGDTVSGLVGALDFGAINSNLSIRGYRLQVNTPSNVTFTRVNARTAAPEDVGGNVKVASFNVLNYFNTFNSCYPTGSADDCRGADSAAEFSRQRAKIINAIAALDADVVGVIEMENDGSGSTSAIQDLVNGLNAKLGAGTYALIVDPTNDPVADTGRLGSDAIKVGQIYKPARVTPNGVAISSADTVFSRPPVAQTYTIANGEKFSVIINHFKSKGSCPSDGSLDTDQGDGQGCWNAKRVQQATEMLSFIDTVKTASGDPDVLVMGDLNAYGNEDPIFTLTSGGLVNQLQKRIATPYSYVFDGLAGYLDHALTTASLDTQVAGVTEWHINADEPTVIDYNTEYKNPDLYTSDPYRASDHDPVLIGLSLGEEVPTVTPSLTPTATATPVTPTATGTVTTTPVTPTSTGTVTTTPVTPTSTGTVTTTPVTPTSTGTVTTTPVTPTSTGTVTTTPVTPTSTGTVTTTPVTPTATGTVTTTPVTPTATPVTPTPGSGPNSFVYLPLITR
ncbi:ExeM/NucH family extracellular endonuclease [Chloroflexia bacterium SDU3-3]|nr:ExeM/NucH family extracellular endonuclease [Chloroflexia bacterium SDU3-3]